MKYKDKIVNKIWEKLVFFLKGNRFYYLLYKSFWYYKILGTKSLKTSENYFTARPNKGAGIGHQMANWIAGYWFARYFNLRFAHTPFPDKSWENFLGFGKDEVTLTELVNEKGYQRVLLPLFDEYNTKEIELIRGIINAYHNKKVVFIAEQDQFYHNQYEVIPDLKKKFYSTNSRAESKLIYKAECYNLAIHVRRGDITNGKNPNLKLRWQNNGYFVNVLEKILETIKTSKPINIFIFSQGKRENFLEFEKFGNITFCLDMDVRDSFLHMVYADLLITSKSSFSYKPALLSNGIKVVPKEFWHGYPNTTDFILVDEKGNLTKN